jgi:hypothetical protein
MKGLCYEAYIFANRFNFFLFRVLKTDGGGYV